MSYTVWDIETSIGTYMKRKASPFLESNIVVASGWKRKGAQGIPEGLYFGRGAKPFDWFTRLLKDTKLLVGQNIKFDLLYALREPQNLEAWMEYVADGGNIWDIQLAEYLLQGMSQSSHMLSLDQMVVPYGGTLKIDEVKALWEAGVDTPNIDRDLLMNYLLGDGATLGDIGNTELIFLKQVEKARASGQARSILLNQGALIATIEMERNGMYVDKELGIKLAAELEAELKKITDELRQYLPKDLPFDFNWSNRYHLSPIIFGGKIKYPLRVHVHDPDTLLPMYTQKSVKHYYHARDFEIVDGKKTPKLISSEIIDGMPHPPECLKFKDGKNVGERKSKMVSVPDLTKPKMRWEDRFYTFPGYTTPEPEWASSTEGLYSVKEAVITELGARDIPFLKVLSRVATLTKDLGTYFIRTDPETGEATGMLTLVGVDSIIHHRINGTSTVTARYSSSDPNLQNVSGGQYQEDGSITGSKIKLVFVSRFGVYGQIVQDDFTALEIYIQALLTKCKQLEEDLKKGLDMHCARVGQSQGVSYEGAVRLCVKEAIPEWVKKRKNAKVFSFQRAYGAGVKKICLTTGMSKEEVESLIRAEEERYPETVSYNKEKTARIKKSRRATSIFVPHPEVRGLQCQLGIGHSVTPDGKVYTYWESPSPGWVIRQGGLNASFSPTEISNYEIQGAGGEWAKAACWLAVRAFYKAKNFGGRALLVNMVHDAIYADIHKDVLVKAAATLHAAMLGANDFMEWYFNWKVNVPVPAVCSHGDNMMQEVKFGEDHKELADKIRVRLRELYMDSYVPSFLKEAA